MSQIPIVEMEKRKFGKIELKRCSSKTELKNGRLADVICKNEGTKKCYTCSVYSGKTELKNNFTPVL